MSRVTKTLEPSPQSDWQQMELPSMSYAGGSLAKTSVTLEEALALKASGQDYGAKSPVWLASYAPDTSSWKTSQHSLVEGLDEFSETWPRSGMTRSGIAYQLPPLALRTYGTGYGSLPTHSIPTPTSSDHIERQNTTGALNLDTNKAVTLNRFVQFWPTPKASAAGPDFAKMNRSKTGLSLATSVAMWPTPTVQDAKNNGGPSQSDRNTLPLNAQVGGALNPTWVEWLMGFPLGWTVSRAWETRSSRKSRK